MPASAIIIIMEGYYVIQKGENDDDDDELIILRIPLQPKKRKFTNNNNNIKDFFKNLTYSTEQCITILVNNFGINKSFFYTGTNFYCPFHENKNTSKSPSAKFTSKNHTYICFSSNCPLKKTRLNSIHLLKELIKL